MPEIPFNEAYEKAAQLLGQSRVEVAFLNDELAKATLDYELLPVSPGVVTFVHRPCGKKLLPRTSKTILGVGYIQYRCDCPPNDSDVDVWLVDPHSELTSPESRAFKPAGWTPPPNEVDGVNPHPRPHCDKCGGNHFLNEPHNWPTKAERDPNVPQWADSPTARFSERGRQPTTDVELPPPPPEGPASAYGPSRIDQTDALYD